MLLCICNCIFERSICFNSIEHIMKTISLIGSTGSIGTQTLDVCRKHNIKVKALATGSNADLLAVVDQLIVDRKEDLMRLLLAGKELNIID